MITAGKVKVVIAEDDFLVRKATERVLRDLDCQLVGTASTGREAVARTEELKPDVVIMDIEMPDLDGLEATRLIQESCPTPVVILTAHETRDFLDRAGEVGVGAYIMKPPNAGEVERGIHIAMTRHADLMKIKGLYREAEDNRIRLQKALEEIKTLQGILPICMHCKKMRDDDGYWTQLEEYLSRHTNVKLSHGICRECFDKHYSHLQEKTPSPGEKPD